MQIQDTAFIQTIPLNQLHPSPKNVRKTSSKTISDLAASIASMGRLLQNLNVERVAEGYEVVSGGRRLLAMRQLVAEGRLADDFPVPCMVVDGDIATEVSTAENVIREQMHPADEFVAFNELVQEGMTTLEIAARFGCGEAHVTRMLKLAKLAPVLVDAYRAGTATLEQLMALALVDDHDVQLRAWEAGEQSVWLRRPEQLRAALVQAEVQADSPMGRFVGVEAYEAAGGAARRDLFTEFVTLPDSQLVNQVAIAKLDAAAAELKAKGWGWTEARLSFDYLERQKLRQVTASKPDPKLGAIVTINRSTGELEVIGGLVKPGQKVPAGKVEKGKGKPTTKTGRRETIDNLLGIRTGILRRHLREEPSIALAVLAASLGADMLRNFNGEPAVAVLPIEASAYTSATVAAGIKLVDEAGAEDRARWEKRLTAGAKKEGSIFAWLLTQEESVTFDLLAFVAASTVTADNNYSVEEDAEVHRFAKQAGVEFEDEWGVTLAWLGAQPRSYIIEAVTDATGAAAVAPLEKLKAKEFLSRAYELLCDANWVPPELRAPAPKPAPEPKGKTKQATKTTDGKKKAAGDGGR